jgi:hypothetical protein
MGDFDSLKLYCKLSEAICRGLTAVGERQFTNQLLPPKKAGGQKLVSKGQAICPNSVGCRDWHKTGQIATME